MQEIKIKFPKSGVQQAGQAANSTEELTLGRSMVIVGANGAGKSKLGVWLAKTNGAQTEQEKKFWRLPAPKAFSVRNIPLLTYEQAHKRYLDQITNNSESQGAIQGDITDLLALLCARRQNAAAKTERLLREANTITDENSRHELFSQIDTSPSDLEKIVGLWGELYERQIELSHPYTEILISATNARYGANEASDGEKAGIFHISMVLCAPADSVLIIDEPETHLHKALMGKLWSKIQELRPDCRFIYITHDLAFASSVEGEKIFLQKYEHQDCWTWQNVPHNEDVPEALIMEILGSRVPTLLVEGDLDEKLYPKIYPQYKVKRRGNCGKVIKETSALNRIPDQHHLAVVGIIDEDYRTPSQVTALGSNTHVIKYKEVEAFLLLPDVVELITLHLSLAAEKGEELGRIVMDDLNKNRDSYAAKMTMAELERTTKFHWRRDDDSLDKVIARISELTDAQKIQSIYEGRVQEIKKALTNSDIEAALRIVSSKNLLPRAGQLFGCKGAYEELVLGLLHEPVIGEKLREVIRKHAPKLPLPQ